MTNKPWAIVLCKFSDLPLEPHPPQFYREYFTEEGAGVGGGFDYWRDVTYGKLDLTNSEVFGWFTVPHDRSEIFTLNSNGRPISYKPGFSRSTLGGWGRDAARANNVDLNKFSYQCIVFNDGHDHGSDGDQVVLVYNDATWEPTFIFHELGHVIGLDHSFGDNPTPCAGGDNRPGAYCDRWDIMSAMNVFSFQGRFGVTGPRLNVPNLERLNCIPSGRIWHPTSQSGSSTITLAALNYPEVEGFFMAKISSTFGGPSDMIYTVELRQKSDWDRGIPRDTVLVHEIRQNALSYLLKGSSGSELQQGDELNVSNQNLSVYIKVLGIDQLSSSAGININWSLKNPSTSSFNYVMAWKGDDNDQRIWYSIHDGSDWWVPQQIVSNVWTSYRPTLAVYNEKLFMAWKGMDTDQRIWYTTYDGTSWSPQQRVLGVGTSVGPALTVYNGKLFMAWKGLEGDQGIYYATFDGTSWSPQQRVLGVGTSVGPALTVYNGKLFMAWKGLEGDQGIYYATFDGTSWSPQQLVPNVWTSVGPALVNTF